MVSQHLQPLDAVVGVSQHIFFTGDNVRLAGQIDYPSSAPPSSGYPLIFIIQHATCTSRSGYTHYTRIGCAAGAAVFRWDKRGTGRSGSGGGGSVIRDTLNAYISALSQPGIDPQRTVIIAQNEGTVLLRDSFDLFSAQQKPIGAVLAGNMLDEEQIIKIDVPVHVLTSKNDWNDWRIYARDAAEAHAVKYGYGASYYVAPNSDRRLMYTNGSTFHRGAASSITKWLETVCQISPLI